MASTAVASTSVSREVTKAGVLQLKTKRKVSSILGKKVRYFYQDGQWVVLCVHNERIPLLEWYQGEQGVTSHRPTKVLDLFDCAHVTVAIEDDRCFLVTFEDSGRPPLEFAALNRAERQEWVTILSATLTRLNCMKNCDNLYTPLPTVQPSRPVTTTSILDDDESLLLTRLAGSPPPRLSSTVPLSVSSTLSRSRSTAGSNVGTGGGGFLDRGIPLSVDEPPHALAPPRPPDAVIGTTRLDPSRRYFTHSASEEGQSTSPLFNNT